MIKNAVELAMVLPLDYSDIEMAFQLGKLSVSLELLDILKARKH